MEQDVAVAELQENEKPRIIYRPSSEAVLHRKRQSALVGEPLGFIPVPVTLTPAPGVTEVSTSLVEFIPGPMTSTIVEEVTLGPDSTSSQVFIRTGVDGPFSYVPSPQTQVSSAASSTPPAQTTIVTAPPPTTVQTIVYVQPQPTSSTSVPIASHAPLASSVSPSQVTTMVVTVPTPSGTMTSNHGGSGGSSSSKAWIAGPVAGGILLLVATVVLVLYLRRRRLKNKGNVLDSVENSPRSELSAGFEANRHEMAGASMRWNHYSRGSVPFERA